MSMHDDTSDCGIHDGCDPFPPAHSGLPKFPDKVQAGQMMRVLDELRSLLEPLRTAPAEAVMSIEQRMAFGNQWIAFSDRYGALRAHVMDVDLRKVGSGT